MLQVTNVRKSFGTVRATDGVSFQVAKGEVVGLLGPNGAGKTTTMRLITGFLKPEEGSITVDGISVLDDPQEARKHIGYLPENAPLYPDMEVTEFLTYMATLRGVAKEKQSERLKETIHLCGLQEVVGRPISELSRGYKQRVCLGQALIHEPQLLILDEPTTGLDPIQIQEIRNVIKEIGKEKTVILSTHIMQEVQAVCRRALIISKGKLVGEGTLDQLIQQGRTGGRYFVKIKASEQEIQKQINQLQGFSIQAFSPANGAWQKVVMQSQENADRCEDVFNWVVKNRWGLSELRFETTSLEEVFLELTK